MLMVKVQGYEVITDATIGDTTIDGVAFKTVDGLMEVTSIWGYGEGNSAPLEEGESVDLYRKYEPISITVKPELIVSAVEVPW